MITKCSIESNALLSETSSNSTLVALNLFIVFASIACGDDYVRKMYSFSSSQESKISIEYLLLFSSVTVLVFLLFFFFLCGLGVRVFARLTDNMHK